MTVHLSQEQLSTIATSSSMEDILQHVCSFSGYAEATRRDYAAQVRRCLAVYNANRLGNVPADLDTFQRRWTTTSFDPDLFASARAYKAWRKKMRSILREYFGEAAAARERRSREDLWSSLIAAAERLLANVDSMRQQLVPLKSLADEARKRGMGPDDLSNAVLKEMVGSVAASRRTSLVRSVRLLEDLRDRSTAIAGLLPNERFDDLAQVRRLSAPALPRHIEDQVGQWIDGHCQGEPDFVTGEHEDALSPQARDGYRAAMRKYLGTAIEIGAVSPELPQIPAAFTSKVLREVLRAWLSESDPARRIADRTVRRYIQNIKLLVAQNGGDLKAFQAAIASTTLKKGHADDQTMSLGARKFCVRLVKDRHYELVFRSLHRAFQRRAQDLIRKEGYSPRAIQLGVLAAFAAIELWGVPLRVENALGLRHLGEEPSLILPRGKRDYGMILVPGAELKNGKPVRARILRSPARALEVLDWYLAEIRPRIPYSDRSVFLFPGWEGPKMSDTALRNWLFEHASDLGLPMRPHNFRHGQASLYLKHNPGDFAAAARLLGDNPGTVRAYYAWLDEEAEMERVQHLIASSAGLL